MPVYLVNYNLNRENKRPPMMEAVEALSDNWAKLGETDYAVETQMTVGQVYRQLSHLIDDNDQLYVIRLTHPHCGFGYKEVNDWLNARLGSPAVI